MMQYNDDVMMQYYDIMMIFKGYHMIIMMIMMQEWELELKNRAATALRRPAIEAFGFLLQSFKYQKRVYIMGYHGSKQSIY